MQLPFARPEPGSPTLSQEAIGTGPAVQAFTNQRLVLPRAAFEAANLQSSILNEDPRPLQAAEVFAPDDDDEKDAPPGSQDKLFVDCINGYIPCLDLVRVYCVIFVAIEHGDDRYGKWNVLYGQCWVLQYLFVIGGISWALTSKPLLPYLRRLGGYAVVGVAVNWSAWLIKGKDWRNNFWDVVFQFWFVVGLMLFCAILTPIKQHLSSMQGVPELRTALANVAAAEPWGTSLCGGLTVLALSKLTVAALFWVILIPLCQYAFAEPVSKLDMGDGAEFWGWPTTESQGREFIAGVLSYFQVTTASILIILVSPRASSRYSMIGWLIIANMYSSRCIEYRASDARLVSAFDLVLLGIVCTKLGLTSCRVVGRMIVRYWFVFAFVLAIIWVPGTHVRMDEEPPEDLEMRIRYNALEMVFIIFLLCAMEQVCDPKIFTKDNMFWMNEFALLVFLTHKAIHIVMPEPWNWFCIILLAPACYIMRHHESGDGKMLRRAM